MKTPNKEKPVIMFVRTTKNCNSGCFMCDFAHTKGQPFLTRAEVEKIASRAKKSGIKLIRFTGGEPLLDPKTNDYIAYLHGQGFKTSLITNGYLLPVYANSLASSGLDQIILSLDGSTSELHEKLRNFPGLFTNAIKGIREIKSANADIVVRINTVVSPYNIGDLEQILELLQSLNVDQWSLIPLKGHGDLWQRGDLSNWLIMFKSFQESVKNIDKPKLLGYSKQWAGRNTSEATKYFTSGVTYTPKYKCDLVRRVRFYIPQSDKLAACNCIPWRLNDVNFNTDVSLGGLNDGTMAPLVEYLSENGPKVCKGCEPINAFLGEHPEILEENIFLF